MIYICYCHIAQISQAAQEITQSSNPQTEKGNKAIQGMHLCQNNGFKDEILMSSMSHTTQPAVSLFSDPAPFPILTILTITVTLAR